MDSLYRIQLQIWLISIWQIIQWTAHIQTFRICYTFNISKFKWKLTPMRIDAISAYFCFYFTARKSRTPCCVSRYRFIKYTPFISRTLVYCTRYYTAAFCNRATGTAVYWQFSPSYTHIRSHKRYVSISPTRIPFITARLRSHLLVPLPPFLLPQLETCSSKE